MGCILKIIIAVTRVRFPEIWRTGRIESRLKIAIKNQFGSLCVETDKQREDWDGEGSVSFHGSEVVRGRRAAWVHPTQVCVTRIAQ